MIDKQTIPRKWAVAVFVLALALSAQGQKTEHATNSTGQKSVRQKTIGQIESEIKSDPNNPHLYVVLGLAYWDKNDYPHAFDAFQHAVKVGPSSAEAHNWLGVALLEKADLPGATAEFRKAVSLDSKSARAYTNLGSALAKSGDLAGAVEAFQKALALEPNSLVAHMNLGVALREKGDAEGALLHLRRVAAATPTNANVQYELGQTLRQSGDLVRSDCGFRERSPDRSRVARRLLRAGRGVKTAERVGTQAGHSSSKPRGRFVQTRPGICCARRS